MQRIDKPSELDRSLLLIDLLSVIFILTIVFLPELKAARVSLGIPFLLLFPGYSAVSALYPKKDFEATERLIYGLGLSLAFIPPLGILLNWSPYGLNLTTTVVSLFSLMLLFTVLSWWRRRRIPPESRFRATFPLSDFRKWLSRESKAAIGCAVAMLLFAGGGFYLVTHQCGNEFTEFYLVGEENLEPGANAVEVGIVNHEGAPEDYAVEVLTEGCELGRVEGINLDPGESWKGEISFQLAQNVENSVLRFVLYRNSERTKKKLWVHYGGN